MRGGKWIAALALAGAPLSTAWADAAPVAATPEAGRKAYTSYCARCHGFNLVVSGGGAYDLRRFPPADKERFVRSVSDGVRAMPAWGGIVKPGEVDAIWAYIGAVNGWE